MTRPSFVLRMFLREARSHGRGFGLFMAAISLGVAALVAIRSAASNMEEALDDRGRELLGADVSLRGPESDRASRQAAGTEFAG